MKYKLLFTFCFLSISAFSQNLSIFNEYEEKKFESTSIFDIMLSEVNPALGDSCCERTQLIGTLIGVTKDSFQMRVTKYSHRISLNGIDLNNEISSIETMNYSSFPRNNLLSLKNYSSFKTQRRKKSLNILGGILIITAIMTTANTIVVKDKASKNMLLYSGGVQLGLGIGCLMLGGSKTYYFKGNDDLWRIR